MTVLFMLPQDNLDEKLIGQAETLLAFVIVPDHRQMVVNNMGKSGGTGRTLKYVLTLRAQKIPVPEDIRMNVVPEFVKHLIPAQKVSPAPATLVPVVRLPGLSNTSVHMSYMGSM
jgi:hypothetical protein